MLSFLFSLYKYNDTVILLLFIVNECYINITILLHIVIFKELTKAIQVDKFIVIDSM